MYADDQLSDFERAAVMEAMSRPAPFSEIFPPLRQPSLPSPPMFFRL